MEGTDENFIDDLDTYDILRRAKEREHNRTWKAGTLSLARNEKEGSIERMIEKMDKKGSLPVQSPEKTASTSSLCTRPILKPVLSNDKDKAESRTVKKCVTTFDALTGDTIVESKTFISDNDDSEDEEMEDYEEQEEVIAENMPVEEEVESEEPSSNTTSDKKEGWKKEMTPRRFSGLQKLAEFHSMEIDSPVHTHTPLETFSSTNDEDVQTVSAFKRARSSRLSALAKTINEWEDDYTHHSIPGSRFTEASSNTSRASIGGGRSKFTSASSPSASSPVRFGAKQGITGELQGFSKRQGSPLRQVRETAASKLKDDSSEEEDTPLNSSRKEVSPGKTYFGGSPFKGSRSPKKLAPQPPVQSPVRSPVKPALNLSNSPVKSSTPVSSSPVRTAVPVVTVKNAHSPLMNKSPVKPCRSGSPAKNAKSENDLNRSIPVGKPISAIRMKFEGGNSQTTVGPVKPDRTRLKPYTSSATHKASSNAIRPLSPEKRMPFSQPEKDPSSLTVAERARLFEKSNFCPIPKTPVPVVVEVQPKKVTVFTSSPYVDDVKQRRGNEISTESAKNVKRVAPPPPVALTPGKPPLPPSMPTTSTPTSSKRRSSSPVRGMSAESHSVKRIKVNAPKPGKMYPSLTDIETETETETEGHCSEVESMDDSLESQQSLGTQIETIAKACSPIRITPGVGGRIPARYRPSEDFSATFACATVDALIDEALEGQDVTGTTVNFSMSEAGKESFGSTSFNAPTTSSENTVVNCEAEAESVSDSANSSIIPADVFGLENDALEDVSYSEAETTASSSFSSSPIAHNSSALSTVVNVDNFTSSHEAAELPFKNLAEVYQAKEEEEPVQPRQLVHTVSFYRRQQQQQHKKGGASSALNDISEHPENIDELSDEDTPVQKKEKVGDTIKKLEEEVEGRNLAIAQASKALNWCKALVGFSDSTEYIECERILLIETQRRLGLLNSIYRLKTDGALGKQMPLLFSPSKQEVAPSCKGNMKITDVSVSLKRDYFSAHRAECQYHFICLVKNRHHIEHTSLLTYDSQKQGSTLRFVSDFLLQGLEPGFQVQLEVYYLESAKEYLPHEAKYRINAKKDPKQATLLSPLLTPSKKSSKGEHSKSHFHSPAGPDAVKSTSFKLCGSLSIDISSLQRTHWGLDNASGPVNGDIKLKIHCSAMGGVEHKGFLTLFDDVSGYGAWVRRWCRLGPAVLEFWKYPEDETEGRKPPLGSLNLHECVTSKVRPASRDICARANTLLLVTTRAPHPNDKDTLVTSCHKGYTAVRHLISADLREERDVWCQKLNKALANLRAWDPVAKQSVDDNLF